MLTLTRKRNEAVVITIAGVEVEVTVAAVGPGRVSLAIAGPPAARIDRKEVHERRKAEDARRTTTTAA